MVSIPREILISCTWIICFCIDDIIAENAVVHEETHTPVWKLLVLNTLLSTSVWIVYFISWKGILRVFLQDWWYDREAPTPSHLCGVMVSAPSYESLGLGSNSGPDSRCLAHSSVLRFHLGWVINGYLGKLGEGELENWMFVAMSLRLGVVGFVPPLAQEHELLNHAQLCLCPQLYLTFYIKNSEHTPNTLNSLLCSLENYT